MGQAYIYRGSAGDSTGVRMARQAGSIAAQHHAHVQHIHRQTRM